MNKRIFLPLILTVVAVVLFMPSCSKKNGSVFDFADRDASFTLTFTGEAGEVSCSCTREGEYVTATVVSPERSRGIKITSDGENAIISVNGAEIPLSSVASKKFTSIFDVMFRGDEQSIVKKSEDGRHTVITYADGEVTVDEMGIPISVNVGRVVKISDYATKE